MIKILIVEDELLIANYMKEILVKEGYEVTGIARDSGRAEELFKACQPDIVCMDIKIKGEKNGIETASLLRKIGDFKLIYITAYGMRDLVTEAQETHPIGFLVKPVTDQTVLATVATALSYETPEKKNHVYIIDLSDGRRLSFNSASGEVSAIDFRASLTSQEVRVLVCLIENNGDVVSFKDLREYIWSDCNVSEASLKTVVWRIRQKLGGFDIISTLTGFGYSLSAEAKVSIKAL